MNSEMMCQKIDQGYRFLLYLLVIFLPTGKAAIEVCAGLGFVLWLARCIIVGISQGWKEAFRLPESPLNRSIGLFLLICALSTLGSAFWEQSARGLLSKTLEWFIIFFMSVAALKKPRHVKVLTVLFLLTTSVTVVDGLVQFFWLKKDIFFGRALVEGYRVTAGMAHANSLGAYLTVSLPVTLSVFFAADVKSRLKQILAFLLLTQGIVLGLTYTRGAYLAAVLSVALVLFKGGGLPSFIKRRRNAVVLAFAVVLLLGMMLGPQWDRARHLTTTLEWRAEIWRDCLTMIARRPFFGHGPNTFMMLFPAYRLSPILRDTPSFTYAHNCFLQLTAETGLLGLISFLGVLGAMLKVWAGIRPPDGVLSWLGTGIGAGLIGFLAHSAVDTHFYSLQLSSLFWMFAGVLISVSRMLSQEAKCDINSG